IAQDAGEMISGSVLDYLRHKALAYIVLAPTEKLRLKIDATYRYRQGHYVADDGKVCDYGGVMLLNAKLEYCIKTVTLFAEGHNLANTPYRDHGGVPQPGIMFFAGARVGLGNK
ncbi:MAG: TonB-dependent receptor, partial [Bacteroidales bacterium]|nr:TonB-dependent receptor [Bacteroidales bacterium]